MKIIKFTFSKDILSSCQILIDYIQKENFNKNVAILDIIRNLPQYIEIDELLKSFFIENSDENENNNDGNTIQMFSINTLINIYNLIEFICWEQFKNNLNEQYKIMSLSDEVKKSIKNYIESKISENCLIQIEDISAAVRRLISRYLSGKRGDTDIDEYKILFDFIQRADLWKNEFQDDDNFQTEIYIIFEGMKSNINLTVQCNNVDNYCKNCQENKIDCKDCDKCNCGLRIGHALEFYEIIKEEPFENKFEEYIKEKKNKDKKKEEEKNGEEKKEEDEEMEINTNQINEQENENENENEANESEEPNEEEESQEEEDLGEI